MRIKNISVDGDYNHIEETALTDFYVIKEPLHILIEFINGDKLLVQTNVGFMTDYMSIPSLFEEFIAKDVLKSYPTLVPVRSTAINEIIMFS